MSKLRNRTKNRVATPNEIAKHILIDALNAKSEFIYEDMHLEGQTDKSKEEIYRHFDKHLDSIIKRLSNGDNIGW